MLEEKEKQGQTERNRRSTGNNGGDCFWEAAGETRGEVSAGGSAPNEECSDDDYDARLLGKRCFYSEVQRIALFHGISSAGSAIGSTPVL